MYKTEDKPKIVITDGFYHVSWDDECRFVHLWQKAFDWCYYMNGKKFDPQYAMRRLNDLGNW